MSSNLTALNDSLKYIHLWLNTSSPDPIGFANVSGFYGPGAWAAWFLALASSWYSLLESRGFDPNTWLYLAGLNWASVDLLRHMHKLKALWNDGANDLWKKEAASVGAAFTVVCWGQVHAYLQLSLLALLRSDNAASRGKQRVASLLVGVVLPVAAMVASMFMMGAYGGNEALTSCIPALYYDGMPVLGGDLWAENNNSYKAPWFSVFHDTALLYAGSLGFVMAVLLLMGYTVSFLLQPMSPFEAVSNYVEQLCRFVKWLCPKAKHNKVEDLLDGPLTYVAILSWIVAMYFAVVFFVLFLLCVDYSISVYLRRVSPLGKACFFMPCAPQSIKEMDQAFALFLGIFSLTIVEIAVPCWRSRKERRERRSFEQDVERRIEMSVRERTSRSQPDSLARRGVVASSNAVQQSSEAVSSEQAPPPQ